jgi:hypothetical protein
VLLDSSCVLLRLLRTTGGDCVIEQCWILLIYRALVLLVFFYLLPLTYIYHVLSSSNINKRHKRTQEIYPGENPATFLR